jgi:CRISPR-associated protein Cmr1
MAKSGSSEAGNYLPAREFIEPGSRFTLILSSRLGASRVEQTLRDAIYSLWLLVQLGGLGSRSRRCAGSLATLPMGSALTQQLDVPFAQQATPQQLKIVLEQGIRTIRHNLAKGWNNPQQSLPPMFDIITPECCQIWVVKGARAWQTADQAVEGIGAALRDFRSSDAQGKSDHDSVLNWFANPKLAPALKRVAFGLPIPFRYSDGGPRDVLEGSEHERRSSPLHMRVSRLSQEYVGVLTLFKSQFLEKGKPPHSKDERIALRNKKLTASPPADYRFIEKFVVEQFDALEVKFQ